MLAAQSGWPHLKDSTQGPGWGSLWARMNQPMGGIQRPSLPMGFIQTTGPAQTERTSQESRDFAPAKTAAS